MRLKNVAALVTGASSGIGQAVSSHFRREGARLLLTGRKERLGTVDVVVLNHGLQASSPLTDMPYDDAKNVLDSNLLSAFLVMKHFAPLMPAEGGSFVCVGSRLGIAGKPEEV